ncbi:MAG: methyltransferase domain-containing protein [Candidatus Paceibacterota bacterium]
MRNSINKIKKYYESPVENGKTRFEIWENGKNMGNSMTPSTSHKKYRERMIVILNKLLNYTSGNRILSCGCGNAFIERLLLDSSHNVLATDVCESALGFAKNKGLKTRVLNASKPFGLKENYFDLSFSDGLIGHLLDSKLSVKKFIKENKKVLKEQGLLFISNESTSNNEDIEYISRADYYFTSPQYLKSELRKNGFEAIQSLLVPYRRPSEGIQSRVWTWGFKPRKKNSIPDFKRTTIYKGVAGVSLVPFKGKSPFSYIIIKPNIIMEPHEHPYTEHIYYLINGKLEININGKSTVMKYQGNRPRKINELFLNKLPQVRILPKQSHGIKNIGNAEADFLCYENPPHK